jgi:monoamine oxidase
VPHDVLVVGGGFAGVTAAREAALRGRSVLLLEARDRLGGRTWTAPWEGVAIEYGGGWVHWHQPHTWSEITRAGARVALSGDPDEASWHVGAVRRSGTIEQRDEIAERGWNAFVAGVEEALPAPHDPLLALERLRRFDSLSIAERVEQLDLGPEEHDVLWAELESLAHAPLEDAGAVAVLRWHALSGYSLRLAQYTGGRVTLVDGTRGLIEAIAAGASFETRLGTPVAAIAQTAGRVEVHTRAGETLAARAAIVAVPLNVLGRISFDPDLSQPKRDALALGQASRGIKIFLRARGGGRSHNAIRPHHPFGYLDTESELADGSQLMIGFGPDAARCDPADTAATQRQLDAILPGCELLAATAHDWLRDEFSLGTWAIHRPGWYARHHAAMQTPEGRVLLAGSDIANGWSGFIDGAIETGITSAAKLERLLG